MGKQIRVLVVEDSEDDALLLIRELKRGGFEPEYERVDTPDAMNAVLDSRKWDIVISDYMMPRFSGLEALKLLRKKEIDIPFIIVSGKIGEDIAVDAMKAGAQDYITKGNLARLIPAIERELIEAKGRIKRKLAEEALRKSKRELIESQRVAQERSKRYHALFEQAGDGIFMLDTNGKILSVNETFARMHGLSAEEIIQNGLDRLDVEGVTKIPERMHRILAGETLSFEVEHYHKDGHIFPLLVTANLITTVNERFIIAIHRDLSERKRAEEALRESKALMEAVVENVPLMIFLKEAKDLRFVIFNRAGEELVGYDRKDLLGKSDLDFFPPEQAANFMAKDREVLAGELGLLDIPEEPIMTARKGERLLHTRKVCIRGTDGTTKYLLGISEDITERKRVEDKIRASLEEKEVLLREIHHRVKNNMQIISSLLNLQMGYITDKKITDIFSESQNRILSMALVHEKLYRSSDLRNIDFKGYINDLGANLLQSYNANNIKLNLNVEDISLDIDLAVPVGLIINELITNSIKYAFPDGMKGELTISFRSIGENMLELVISDNGIGLAKDLDVKKSKTLGLHLVTSLAKSQLQGQIDINRDKGTEFQIKFKGRK